MTKTTASRLTNAATRLSTVLDLETKVLRTASPKDIQALRQEKEVLANLYSSLMAEMRQDGSADHLHGQEAIELRQAADHLHTATEANAIALDAAMHANRRISETVAAAVRSEMAANQTYGRDGRLGGTGAKAGAPLSFNKSL